MTTIKDILIAPYEIDVDNHNFTLVEVSISKGGEVAGKQTEAGKKIRKFVGYFNTLPGCINRILQERINIGLPELEDKIVDLKTFLSEQRAYKAVMVKWVEYLGAPFKITENDGVPSVTPRRVLDNAEITE